MTRFLLVVLCLICVVYVYMDGEPSFDDELLLDDDFDIDEALERFRYMERTLNGVAIVLFTLSLIQLVRGFQP